MHTNNGQNNGANKTPQQLAREIFPNLKQFVIYCEEFIRENQNDYEEKYKVWLVLINDFKGTIDELIRSYTVISDMYFYWEIQACNEEEYECAAIIKHAIDYEIKYYIKLAKDLFNEDINEKIKEINKQQLKKIK